MLTEALLRLARNICFDENSDKHQQQGSVRLRPEAVKQIEFLEPTATCACLADFLKYSGK